MVCMCWLQILEALFEQRDLTEQETTLAIEVSLGLPSQLWHRFAARTGPEGIGAVRRQCSMVRMLRKRPHSWSC